MLSCAPLDSYINEQIAQGIIPGAVIVIFRDNQVLHKKAYGYAQQFRLENMDKLPADMQYLEKIKQCQARLTSPIPLTTDYLFDLASVTKALAATYAVMLLVDQHKLQLDEPVCRFIPEFNSSDKKMITARHLLSHTSGLLPWKPVYYHADNMQDAIHYISTTTLQSAVGTQRKYSDLGFMTLRCLVEKISGQTFADFLQQNLYQKLDLTNTLFNPETSRAKIASTSHGNPFEYKMISDDDFGYPCDENIDDFKSWRNYTLTGEANDGNAYHALAGVSGHAGLFSTADDVQVLLQLLLDQGCYHHQQIISPQTIKEFLTKNQFRHGLGWSMSGGDTIDDLSLGESDTHPFMEGVFGHEGFTGTFIVGLPKINAGIIVLTNKQNVGVNATGSYNKLDNFFAKICSFAVNEVLDSTQKAAHDNHPCCLK